MLFNDVTWACSCSQWTNETVRMVALLWILCSLAWVKILSINHMHTQHIKCNAITYLLVEFQDIYSDQLRLLVSPEVREKCWNRLNWGWYHKKMSGWVWSQNLMHNTHVTSESWAWDLYGGLGDGSLVWHNWIYGICWLTVMLLWSHFPRCWQVDYLCHVATFCQLLFVESIY